MARRIAVWILALCPLAPTLAAEWRPAQTHAVIVGVLSWSDKGLTPFPEKNRKDQELCDLLIRRGVPKQQIALLLDKNATRDACLSALKTAARRAKPGDTLIFYYAGHGAKAGRDIAFANYDINPRDCARTGLMLSAIGDLLAHEFRGSSVILLADACHSGGLAKVADRLAQAKVAAVSLTSSEASNLSTRNWTFTQAILDGWTGAAIVDANSDGLVTLDEVADEVRGAMTYREGQRSGFVNRGLPGDLVLGAARRQLAKRGDGPFSVGSYVWASIADRFCAARIVGRDRQKYLVQSYDYTDKRELTLSADQLKPMEFQTFPAGTKLQVMWRGRPWQASVRKVQGIFHLVHYDNYDDSWDEWVLSHRIIANVDAEVEWKGKWYPATIVKRDGAKYYIHYAGFDHSWDEWVTEPRIRLRGSK